MFMTDCGWGWFIGAGRFHWAMTCTFDFGVIEGKEQFAKPHVPGLVGSGANFGMIDSNTFSFSSDNIIVGQIVPTSSPSWDLTALLFGRTKE